MAGIENELFFNPLEPKIRVQNQNRQKVVTDNLRKNFPNSMQISFPTEYDVPKSYLTIQFWDKQLFRLGDWRRNWGKQRNNFKTMMMDKSGAHSKTRSEQAFKMIEVLLSQYDSLIDLCWSGDLLHPPMPVELWISLYIELKSHDQNTAQRIKGLGFKNISVLSFVASTPDSSTNSPTGNTDTESHGKSERLTEVWKRIESLGETGPLFSFIVRNLAQLRDFIEKQKGVSGKILGTKFCDLATILEKGAKEMTEEIYDELKHDSDALAKQCFSSSLKGRLPYTRLPPSLDGLQVVVAKELGANLDDQPIRKSARRGRPPKVQGPAFEAGKKLPMKRPAQEFTDFTANRPKRTRFPARSFTPTHSSESGTSSDDGKKGKKPLTARNYAEYDDDEEELIEEEELTEESYERESSPDMEDFVVMPSSSQRTGRRKKQDLVSELGSLVEPMDTDRRRNTRNKKKISEDSDEPESEDEDVTEKDIMLMNERIYMETTRLNLLRLRNAEGVFHYDYVPTIIECIDRAVEALDTGHIVDYVMHKASVETGAENILQLSKSFVAEGGVPGMPFPLEEGDQMDQTPAAFPASGSGERLIFNGAAQGIADDADQQPCSSTAVIYPPNYPRAAAYSNPFDAAGPSTSSGHRQFDLTQL